MMKRKLLSLLVIIAFAFPVSQMQAGVIIPLKIDDNDNTLSTISASQFYSANPVPWNSLTGTPTTLSGYGITDAQPLDSELTSIADLTYNLGTTERYVPVFDDGSDTWIRFSVGTMASLNVLDLTSNFVSGLLPTEHGGAGFGVLTPTPPTGTSLAVDLTDKSLIEIDTASATDDLTLTFSNAQAGKLYTFKVTHGASARTLIFPQSTQSVSGNPLVTASGTHATDLIAAVYDGTRWLIGPRVDGLSGLEAETIAYVTETGANISLAHQADLDAIVKWLKANNKWSTTRGAITFSNYNAGNGSVVYCLGGLNSDHFDLIGAPTWAPGGFAMDGSTQRAISSDAWMGGSPTSAITVVYMGNISGNTSSSLVAFVGGLVPNSRSWQFRVDSNVNRTEYHFNNTGLIDDWDEHSEASNNILNETQVFAFTFDAGALRTYTDGVAKLNTTSVHSILHDQSDNIVTAHHTGTSGTWGAFFFSTLVWTPTEIAEFTSLLETLDLD